MKPALLSTSLLLYAMAVRSIFVKRETEDEENCGPYGVGCFPKKKTIPEVIQLDYCKDVYKIDTAVSVVPVQSIFTHIQPCLSCNMKLRSAHDNQTMTAIFYSLGLYGATDGHCQRIRIDIFDGWSPSDDTRLSNKNGICGNDLPRQNFQTTNNTMTIRLTTSCSSRPQYGTFNIIVAATKKAPDECLGQFQCGTGQCIDKAFVCDNRPQCPDHSDEKGCHHHHGNRIPTWLVVIFVTIAVALFVLFLVTMIIVCLKYVCVGMNRSGYTKV